MADNNTGQPRGSRKLRELVVGIFVVILLGVVIWGIDYGLNDLAKSGSNSPPASQHPQRPSNVPTNSSAPTQNSTTPSSANTSSASNSLSNSGPGESEIVLFISVSIVGTIGHYAWRKLRSA